MRPAHRFILAAAACFLSTSMIAQAPRAQADSLLTQLPKAKADTNKVKLLNNLAYTYRNINTDSGVAFANQGMKLAQKLNWQKGIYLSATALGKNYFVKGDFPKTFESFHMALKPAEAAKDSNAVSEALLNIGTTYNNQEEFSKAKPYLLRSLQIAEATGNKMGMLFASSDLGVVYGMLNNQDSALILFRRCAQLSKETGNESYALSFMVNIGTTYQEQGKIEQAMKYYDTAMHLAEQNHDDYNMAILLGNIAQVYYGQKNFSKALQYHERALPLVKRLGDVMNVKSVYYNIYKTHKAAGNAARALEAHEQYLLYKDSIFNQENTEAIAKLEVKTQYEKKELADSLRNVEARKLEAVKLQRQKTFTFTGIGVAALLLLVSLYIFRNNKKLAAEKHKSENLLLNILPAEVADELKDRGATTARQFDAVTVLFTDFVDFTKVGERIGSKLLVDELHTCFKAFDEIVGRHHIEKIKTIGDAYLAVCGLPMPDANHAANVVAAAKEITAFMQQRYAQLGDNTFRIRVGIHSGEVVAGIVGVKKFAYDIWGDTVNTAARMEQKSEPGKINISQTTYELVKDKFTCTHRGEIEAKNKGMMNMYFVE